MRKIVLTALTVAATMAGGVPVHGAAQSYRIMASQPVSATPNVAIRLAAVVCNGNGCNVVPTKQKSRRKFKTLGHG